MFSRVIMDTGQWQICVKGIFFREVRVTNHAGDRVSATKSERQYFMEVLRSLRECGVPITAESCIAAAVVTDFSKAIHQRFRRGNRTGGFMYSLFFSSFTPEETARRYLAGYP
jgi:hypothetical protein